MAIITCVVSPAVYAYLRRSDQGDGAQPKPVSLDPLLGHVIRHADGKDLELQLVEILAADFPVLVGKTLAEVSLRHKTGLTLISVLHGDGTVRENPGAGFRIARNDTLFLVGTDAHVKQLEKLSAALSSETGTYMVVSNE